MANLADQRLLALIVDRYLNDNNFSITRNTFRNEAPFLFNHSPNTNQISMNMMGLDEILNELKLLKELMIQEMFLMNLHTDRTQTLLQGMQSAINSYYNHTGVTTLPGNVSTPLMLDQASYQTQLLLFSMQNLINTYNGNTTQPCLLNPNFPVVPPPPNAYSAEVPQPELCSRTPTGVTTPSARFLVPQSTINAENGNFSTYVMMSASNRKRKDTEAMDATSIGKKSRGSSSSDEVGEGCVNTITTPPAGFFMPQSINTDTTIGDVSTPVGVFDLPELANGTYDDLLENISFTQNQNDLQADFPLIDDDLDDEIKTFGDIFDSPDSPWGGVDFHPTPNQLKDNASRPSHECKSQQPSTAAKVLTEKDMNVQGPDSLTASWTTNLTSKRNRQHGFGKENC